MTRTIEEIKALAKINPELEQVLKHAPAMPDITQYEPAQLREGAKLRAPRVLPGVSDESIAHVHIEDITIPARDGFAIPARVYKPVTPPKSGSPLMVMFHGGGFVLGNLDLEHSACKNFVTLYGTVAISVDYRLAPEYKFPAGVNDAWDSVKWAASNASRLGADPSQGFIVGGTSAGANFADVVSHLARDEKLSPPLTGELLIIPALVGDPSKLPEKYAKYKERHFSGEQNKDAPILSRATSQYFMKHYQPDPESHLYRPFIWPSGHAGLPPVSFHVCGMDPLRDDGLIYEEELQAQGVKTKLCLAPGLPHGFTSLFPMLKAAEKFTAEVADGVGWLLKEGKATY